MRISDEVKFLEEVFEVLNEKYFESALQKVAITIQSTPKTHGHFTPWESWSESEKRMNEINIGAESLSRPVRQIVATLLHEMVHYYCHVNNIKDTSRDHTYHNKRFKEECERRGLIIKYLPEYGFTDTYPADELIFLVNEKGWSDRIKLYRNIPTIENRGLRVSDESGTAEKKKSSTRKYVCPQCGLSVRATKVVKIACVECGNVQMHEDVSKR